MSEIYEPAEDSYLLSEALGKRIPALIKKKPNLKAIEIGVGSGIQLQTLSKIGVFNENISGVDINLDAVKNCKKLGFNCYFSNLFSKVEGKYDVILFNAPYLPEDETEPEDSKLITTGGKNGGEIVSEFLAEAKNHLENSGRIFLLVSSLTKAIKFGKFKKNLIAREKLFFEELLVYELEYKK